MAEREHQGYQIALVIFVMLTVLLSITTFMFFKKYREEQQKSGELATARDTAVAERDQRQNENNSLKPLLTSALPDTLDAQLFIGLLQSEWDYVDPATFAPHLLRDPLAGSTTKKILVQESIGDAQVSNLATRYLARTMGIVGMAPLVEEVLGVETQAAPLDSAYTQWNPHAPLPRGSHPACPREV